MSCFDLDFPPSAKLGVKVLPKKIQSTNGGTLYYILQVTESGHENIQIGDYLVAINGKVAWRNESTGVMSWKGYFDETLAELVKCISDLSLTTARRLRFLRLKRIFGLSNGIESAKVSHPSHHPHPH